MMRPVDTEIKLQNWQQLVKSDQAEESIDFSKTKVFQILKQIKNFHLQN